MKYTRSSLPTPLSFPQRINLQALSSYPINAPWTREWVKEWLNEPSYQAVICPNINSLVFSFPSEKLWTNRSFFQDNFRMWLDIDPNFKTLLIYGMLSSFAIYVSNICSKHKVGVTLSN